MANNIDERLLAGNTLAPEEEDGAARELREKRNPSADSAGSGQADEDKEETAGRPSLRQRVIAARQALNLKEQAKKKLEEKVAAPAKAGTSWLLKAAWLNLIDSFGLTLIYINLHVFLKLVLGEKLFCKLGEEWLPKKITEAGGAAGETAGKSFGLVEILALLILDLIAMSIIFGALALIVMIVNFMGASWWGKLTQLWSAFWTLGWDGVSALSDLFGNLK